MHVAWSSCNSRVCCLGCCALCSLAADTLKYCTHRDRIHQGGAEGEGVCYAANLLSPFHLSAQLLSAQLSYLQLAFQSACLLCTIVLAVVHICFNRLEGLLPPIVETIELQAER